MYDPSKLGKNNFELSYSPESPQANLMERMRLLQEAYSREYHSAINVDPSLATEITPDTDATLATEAPESDLTVPMSVAGTAAVGATVTKELVPEGPTILDEPEDNSLFERMEQDMMFEGMRQDVDGSDEPQEMANA